MSTEVSRQRVPDESVVHERTWMAWPDRADIWGRTLRGVQQDIAGIARAIARYEPVTLLANPASAAGARAAVGSEVTVITSIPVDDCWMRDTGPVFRVGEGGRLDALGLHFNGWGGKQTHANDGLVAQRVAAELGVDFVAAGFVGEGGGIETDGRGTLMATASSLANPNRNPGLTRGALERAMLDAYGADEVLWFPGVVGQDITDDHVDATSRFVHGATVLVQLPAQGDRGDFAVDATQQHATLVGSRNALGNPFEVVTLASPTPKRMRQRSRDFLGSYANYLVCNGAVIMPQFGDQAADEAAADVLRSLFPGRAVEQLDIDRLGMGGGGIHCVTQQQPLGG